MTASNPALVHEPLSLGDARLYLATAAMVLGNVLLPYAVHGIPGAGRALLPILFFTLVAGWRYGLTAGLLTAVLSPLANHFLTGMPPAAMLQTLILQGALLGVLAAATRGRRATLPLLALVVLAHQALTLAPSGAAAFGLFKLHAPAILLQILGGWALLRALEPRREA